MAISWNQEQARVTLISSYIMLQKNNDLTYLIRLGRIPLIS